MKSGTILKSLSLVLLGVAAWAAIVALSPSQGEPRPASPAAGEEPPQRPRGSRAPERERKENAAPGMAVTDPALRERILQDIDAAVLSYSPEGVQAIRGLLLDPDPEVRMAARDGMVQLGEPDAVPLLRDAAKKLEDPAEIASFHEAADLLALPPWSGTTEAQEVIAEIIESNSQ